MSIETKSAAIDWAGIEKDTVQSLHLLHLACEASEKDASPEVHAKMVMDLYRPILVKLADFCASIKVIGINEAGALVEVGGA